MNGSERYEEPKEFLGTVLTGETFGLACKTEEVAIELENTVLRGNQAILLCMKDKVDVYRGEETGKVYLFGLVKNWAFVRPELVPDKEIPP